MTWHIAWRACAGRNLVANEQLFEQIRHRLIAAHRAPGRVLLHFLVTPNEIHLLSALPRGEEPGIVARKIANIVARFVHRADGIPGFVFAAPYQARRIEPGRAEWDEFRMLAWRPVVLGLCTAMTYYSFSSLRSTLGLARPHGFNVPAALRQSSGLVGDARNALRDRIASRPSAVEVREWELSRHLVLATGSVGPRSAPARMVGAAAAALVAASDSQDIDGAIRLLERWVLEKLDLRRHTGSDELPRAAAAHVRALIACVAMNIGLCSLSSIARFFGKSKATLSERMSVCRRDPTDQRILDVAGSRIAEEAIALQGALDRGLEVGQGRPAHPS